MAKKTTLEDAYQKKYGKRETQDLSQPSQGASQGSQSLDDAYMAKYGDEYKRRQQQEYISQTTNITNAARERAEQNNRDYAARMDALANMGANLGGQDRELSNIYQNMSRNGGLAQANANFSNTAQSYNRKNTADAYSAFSQIGRENEQFGEYYKNLANNTTTANANATAYGSLPKQPEMPNQPQETEKERNRRQAHEFMDELEAKYPGATAVLEEESGKAVSGQKTFNFFNGIANNASNFADSVERTFTGETGNWNGLFKQWKDAMGTTDTALEKRLMSEYGMTSADAQRYARSFDAAYGVIEGEKQEQERNDYLANISTDVIDLVKLRLANQEEANDRNTGNFTLLNPGTGSRIAGYREAGELTDINAEIDNALLNMGYDVNSDEYKLLEQYVREVRNEEQTNISNEVISKTIENNPGLGVPFYNAYDIITSMGQGAEALTEYAYKANSADPSRQLDPNSRAFRKVNESQAIQNATNKLIQDSASTEAGAEAGQFWYGVGSSTAKSVLSMAVGGAIGGGIGGKAGEIVAQLITLPSFGSSAYATTYKEAVDAGMGQEQSQAYAIASGIAEMLFEELSLDKAYGTFTKNAVMGGKAGIGMAIRDVLAQAGIEGSEEFFTDMSNSMADAIINQGFSQYERDIRNYLGQGLSQEDAEAEAQRNWVKQLGQTFLAGAASGGITGAVTVGGGRASHSFIASDLMKNTPALQAFVEVAKDVAIEGSTASQIANSKSIEELTVNDVTDMLVSMEQESGQATEPVLIEAFKKLGESDEEAQAHASKVLEMASQNPETVTEAQEQANIKAIEESDNLATVYGQYLRGEIENPTAQVQKAVADAYQNSQELKEQKKTQKEGEKIANADVTIEKTGESVSIKSVKAVKGDSITVETNKGTKTIKASEISESPKGNVIRSAVKLDSPAASTAMITNYKGQNDRVYSALSSMFYDQGKTGGDYEGLISSLSQDTTYGSYLSMMRQYDPNDVALKQMYYTGQNQSSNNSVKTQTVNKAKRSEVERAMADISQRIDNSNSPVKDLVKAISKNTPLIFDMVNTAAFNGSFDAETGVISIASNQDGGKQYAAAIHELGEFALAYNPEAMKLYQQAVRRFVDANKGAGHTLSAIKTYQDVYQAAGKANPELRNEANKTVESAFDEYVNDFTSGIFMSENGVERFVESVSTDESLSTDEKKSILQTFKDFFTKIFDILKKLIHSGQVQLATQDAIDLAEQEEAIDALRTQFLDVLKGASENLQAQLEKERVEAIEEQTGIAADEETGTAVAHSVRTKIADTWDILGYKSYEDAIDAIASDLAEKTKVSKKQAKKWLEAEESIAAMIFGNAEFMEYDDYTPDNRYKAIKNNADYPQGTVDLSNLCRKREIFTRLFANFQKMYPDMLFTAEDIAIIRQILVDSNYEVACALCYVEDRRQKVGEIAKSFIDYYKKAVENHSKIEKVNSKKEIKPLVATKDQIKKYNLSAREGDNAVYFYADDDYIPNQNDLVTYEGFKKLSEEHPSIAYAFINYNNSRGMASARLIEGHAEYDREVLTWTQDKVDSVNAVGGLRVFSFSDFEAIHLIDIVQVLMDCATKGVKVQTYTKVPEFARLVRNTGVKLNRSTIPATKNSENAYIAVETENGYKYIKVKPTDEGIAEYNGKQYLAFDIKEGIDITDANFLDERDNPNIGNVTIGVSMKQIRMAMLDPFVDYIIPFHSNQSKKVLHIKEIDAWKNFKKTQEDKKLPNSTSKKKSINIYADVLLNPKYEGKITDKVSFVKAFLEVCEEEGFKPRFAEFLTKDADGHYQYVEGYEKLLVDFKMFDSQGKIFMQGQITPEFDEAFMNEILLNGVERAKRLNFDPAIIKEIETRLTAKGHNFENAKGLKHSVDVTSGIDSVGSVLDSAYERLGAKIMTLGTYFDDYHAIDSDGDMSEIEYGNWIKENPEEALAFLDDFYDNAEDYAAEDTDVVNIRKTIDEIRTEYEAINSSLAHSVDVGYHAGDLGKAEDLWNMTSANRGTGHFGTGTYFVGDEKQISDGNYGNRPHEKVDFSKYHLFRPTSYRSGIELHDALKYINDNIYSIKDGAGTSFDERWQVKKDIENAGDILTDYYGEYSEEEKKKALDTLRQYAERYGRYIKDFEDVEEWTDDDVKEFSYYADEVYEYLSDKNTKLRNALTDIALALIGENTPYGTISPSNSIEMLTDLVGKIQDEVEAIGDPYRSRGADSPSTRLMKALGYEGIDVRGIEGLDNTKYGSVIYDLKDEDLARKQEIGTARFSVDVGKKAKADIDQITYDATQEDLAAYSIIEEGLKEKNSLPGKTVEKIAKDIKDTYGSKIATARLAKDLQGVFNYLNESGNIKGEDLVRVMREVAIPVIEQIDDATEAEKAAYTAFTNALRQYKLSVDEAQLEGIMTEYGSYSEYTRSLSGAVRFSRKNGVNLEDVWSEICDASNGVLDYGENPAYMPIALAEAIQALKPTAQILKMQTMDEAAQDLALEIFRRYFAEQSRIEEASKLKEEMVKRTQKLANKYKASVERTLEGLEADTVNRLEWLQGQVDMYAQLRRKAEMSLDEMGTALYESAYKEYVRRYKKLMANKDRALEAEKKVSAQLRKSMADKAKKRRISEIKKRLMREVTVLQNMLLHPAPAASKHIPENLVKATIDLLQSLNIDNPYNKAVTARLGMMEAVYASYKSEERYDFDYDEKTHQDISELRSIFAGKNVVDLNYGDLERVLDIVTELKVQIMNANNLIIKGRLQDAQAVAKSAVEEIEGSRRYKNPFVDQVNKYTGQMLNAKRFFERISGYVPDSKIMELYDNLNTGVMTQMQIQKEIGDLWTSVLEGRENAAEVRRFISTKPKDLVDIGIVDKDGNPVLVTRAMRMSLIMHSYNEQNMRHILGQGINIPDMYYFAKGDLKNAYAKGKIYRFTSAEEMVKAYKEKNFDRIEEIKAEAEDRINELENDLSEWELNFLEIAKQMFHETTGNYINDTAAMLKGYSIARVKEYFPIKVDGDFTAREWTGLKQDATLEGMGMLKDRVNSKLPVYLEDITNVIQRQTDAVAAYAGLAIPLRNIEMAIHQYGKPGVTMAKALNETWGNDGSEWLQNLLQDLQFGRKEKGNFLTKLRSNFAGAVLSLNPSVAIKQAASFPTAAAVVGHKALAKAFTQIPKGFFAQRGLPELEAINPLLEYRNRGNGTQDLADAKSSDLFKKLPVELQKALNWTQWFDTGTVRTLEYAAKYYVDDKFSDLEKGSDDYWEKVSEVFTRIVTETQPNYSPLYQADAIRNPNTAMKLLVMFKTQPFQNFSIIYDALNRYSAVRGRYKDNPTAENKQALKEAGENAAYAVSSQIISAAVFSAMSILAQAVLHRMKKYKKDDDETQLDWTKLWAAFGMGIFSNFAGGLMWGSELFEAFKAVFLSEKFVDGITKNNPKLREAIDPILVGSYYGIEVSTVEMFNNAVDNLKNFGDGVGDLNKAVTSEDQEKAAKKMVKAGYDLALQIAEICGIPANNVLGMIFSGIYTVEDHIDAIDRYQDTGSLKVYQSNKTNPINEWEIDSQYQRIFNAFINGDTASYEKYVREKAEQQDWTEEDAQDKITSKIISMIKEEYLAGGFDADEAMTYLEQAGKSADDAYLQIGKWDAGDASYSGSKLAGMDSAIDAVIQNPNGSRAAMIAEVERTMQTGVKKESVLSNLKKYFGDAYRDAYQSGKAADMHSVLLQVLQTAGYTAEEAQKKLKAWVE